VVEKPVVPRATKKNRPRDTSSGDTPGNDYSSAVIPKERESFNTIRIPKLGFHTFFFKKEKN